MGFIEEGRQLIQDFVTPEIRSLDARLTAVEKRSESLDAKNAAQDGELQSHSGAPVRLESKFQNVA